MLTRQRSLVLSLAVLATFAVETMAQGLLRDIHPGTGNSPSPLRDAELLGSLGSVALFRANDSIGGTRIWRTDGTDQGTYPMSELAVNGATFTTVWNGALYLFATSTANSQQGLYRTDGTRQGTVLLRNGLSGVSGARVFDVSPDGRLWFFATEAATGSEVWATDGSAAGTQIVVDMLPGSGSGVPVSPQTGGPLELRAAAGFVFFPARTTPSGPVRMWRSDGTLANTLQVSPGAGGGKAHAMEPVGGVMVYAAEDSSGGGSTLYRTDGTDAGTVQLLAPQFGVGFHAVVNNRYVFATPSSTVGNELLTTDGFSLNILADLNPGLAHSFPRDLTVVGNTLYFTAFEPTRGRELWRTNGQPISWSLVADLSFGNPSTTFSAFGAIGNNLWFTADVGGLGAEPWLTNGTPGGTAPVADIVPGTTGSNARRFLPVGNGALFVVDSGQLSRPCCSDGTTTGTRLLRATTSNGSNPADFASSRGLSFFTADDGTSGREPWCSDGTNGGTVRLADTVPGPSGIGSLRIATFADETWFVANGNLWRSRGTPASTQLAIQGLALAAELAATPQALYLTTATSVLRSDGTQAGTTTLFTATSAPTNLVVHGNRVLFAIGSGTTSMQVYTSNGTVGGTTQLLNASGNPARVRDVAADDQLAWLVYTVGINQGPFALPVDGLMRIDQSGTATVVAATLAAGFTASPAYRELTPFLSECFYVDNSTSELWRTNGTALPSMFADLRAGALGSFPSELTVASALLYFTADDGLVGREVWRTDGTLAGTATLDTNPGVDSSSAKNLIAAADGETLVFTNADDAGYEVWRTNGTAVGTRLLDVAIGAQPSDPTFGAVAGTALVFAADDGQNGREPWFLPLGQTEAVLARPHSVPCGHPGGSRPHIGADGLPRIGNLAFGLTVRDAAPLQLCAVFVGVGRNEIPTPAGCTLQLDQLGLPFAFTDAVGTARIGLGIPNDPYFVGFSLAAQFVAIDPPAGPGLFTLSDGFDLLLGR